MEKIFETKGQMYRLNEIEGKMRAGDVLTKEELGVLYGVASIPGIDVEDSRLKKLREKRTNIESDMATVFACKPEQIAHGFDQLNEETRAYVGPLEPGVVSELAQMEIDFIYTSFPEHRIIREEIAVGGKTGEELLTELEENNVQLSADAKSFIEQHVEGTIEIEEKQFFQLTLEDLGLEGELTTEKINARAKEFGLKLMSPESAIYYRLHTLEKGSDSLKYLAMEAQSIEEGEHSERTLAVINNLDSSWLVDRYAFNDREWYSYDTFVFEAA